jgi:hypothetical protein
VEQLRIRGTSADLDRAQLLQLAEALATELDVSFGSP